MAYLLGADSVTRARFESFIEDSKNRFREFENFGQAYTPFMAKAQPVPKDLPMEKDMEINLSNALHVINYHNPRMRISSNPLNGAARGQPTSSLIAFITALDDIQSVHLHEYHNTATRLFIRVLALHAFRLKATTAESLADAEFFTDFGNAFIISFVRTNSLVHFAFRYTLQGYTHAKFTVTDQKDGNFSHSVDYLSMTTNFQK